MLVVLISLGLGEQDTGVGKPQKQAGDLQFFHQDVPGEGERFVHPAMWDLHLRDSMFSPCARCVCGEPTPLLLLLWCWLDV